MIFIILNCTKNNFDIIGITETIITKQVSLLNLNFTTYPYEFAPSETTAGGIFFTLLIIYHINVVMTKISIKTINWNQYLLKLSTLKVNIIAGVIHRHPSMDLTNFNSKYLSKLLEKISKEQISIFVLRDFNINFLNYNQHIQPMNF